MVVLIFSLIVILFGFVMFYGCGCVGLMGFVLFVGVVVILLLFVVIGYSLVFGVGNSVFGGASNVMFVNLVDVFDGMIVFEVIYVLFEFMVVIFVVGILCVLVVEKV